MMRYFYSDKIVGEGEIQKLSSEEEKHIFQTLRGRENIKIGILNGRGKTAEAEILAGKKIIIRKIYIKEYKTNLLLYVSPPRANKMDILLKQCAETGVRKIQPLICERTVSIPKKTKLKRWKKLLVEGIKQSHNPFLPEINMPIKFKNACRNIENQNYQAYFGSAAANFAEIPVNKKQIPAWIVGPEGGFSEKEKEIMLEKKFKPIKISEYVMRTETAALTGAAILIREFQNEKTNSESES